MFYNIPRKPVRASGFSIDTFFLFIIYNRFPVVIMAAGFFEDILSYSNILKLIIDFHPAVREDSRAFYDMRDVKTIIIELQDKVREKNVEPVAVQLQDFVKVVVQEAKNELWELIKNKEII